MKKDVTLLEQTRENDIFDEYNIIMKHNQIGEQH